MDMKTPSPFLCQYRYGTSLIGAVLHNRFDVKVVDAASGKVKQTAVGFNVITDYYFNSRLTGSPMTIGSDLLTYISIGTGSGTPAVTDTALFTYLTRKAVTTLETVYAYPTSHTTKQIKLEATECNGSTITEVALEGKRSYTLSTYYYIVSHAMLQNSEGNQIAIAKTDTDVVYITATFYATCTPSGFGANGVYPPAENNSLLQWLLTGNTDGYVRFSRFPVEYSSDLALKYSGSKSYSFTGGTGNTTTYQYDLPVTTFLDSECNNRIVKHLGVAGVGAFTFPNHDVFPPYAVDHLVIGEGDGATTEFSIKCPLIQSGTVRIFVNDTEMTEGTDYTVDIENNCGDWYENYHTAAMTCKSAGVSFGDLASKTPYTGRNYRDPIAWWDCYDDTMYPSSCVVSDVNPIKIDFGVAKPCNTLKFDILTVPSARLDTLRIQYSNNNTDWTDVSGLSRTSQVWKFTEVLARYWRAFLSGEGNATVVVTSSGMTGSPITLSVSVASSDTASVVAGKIKAAIESNEYISALYDASVADTNVVLTAKAPVANVSNLNIALTNGTCAGLTTVSTSTNTTTGVAAVKQQENIYVTGTIGTAGNAMVVVTAAGMANSPVTVSVPVASGDSSTTVATKVNAALALNSDITDFFTISADNGRYVRLTAKTAADNDATLNISIANGTCTGLTAITTSTVDAAGNAGTKQVETLTVAGSVSYSWTYSLYYQSFPTRDGQSFGSTFFLGKTVPGLKFTTPPADGAAITASFAIEYPFKTENNLLRFTYSVQLQRGDAMTLTFEYTLDAGAGLYPQVIHTSDNLLRFIYLTVDGTVAGSTADPVLGLYDSLTYTEIGRISPDETVSYPSIKKVAHFGAYGFWSAEGDHRFVMYMLPTDITNSFIDGSVKFSIGSEVSQMSCTLLNIKGALLNRYRAFVTPGTKMELYFSLGSSGEITLGIFYIDRASVSYPDEKVSVSARNAIGKLLKEQTFNEDNTFEETTLQMNLQEILRLAEVENFFVGDSTKAWKLRFEPDVTMLDGVKRVISLLDSWKVDETANGVIGVAAATDARFDQPAVYTFERDKTCWSYSVEYDDSEAVSKVCVTCTMLGYRAKNGVFEIVPEEAETVRLIFTLYLEGFGKQAIANRLNEMGVATRFGKGWHQDTIAKMLRNEKYAGDLLLQKTFRTDHLTKQTRVNHGELPQYLVQEAHEPIIDRATFEAVQAEIERRANETTVKKGTATVFTGTIRCGVCGKNYRRKTSKTGFVWICATFNTKGKKFCASKQIPEETLKAVCAEAFGTGSFDDDTFAASIDFITALPDNVLEFHFKDGQTKAVGWQDRSRRESWTDDKRQAAREKATRRNG